MAIEVINSKRSVRVAVIPTPPTRAGPGVGGAEDTEAAAAAVIAAIATDPDPIPDVLLQTTTKKINC